MLTTGSTPSSIYDCSLPSPRTAATTRKVTGRRRAAEVQHRAGALELCRRITERLQGNSLPAQSNHACVNTPAMNLHTVCAAYLPHPEKTFLGETGLPTPKISARWGWVSTPKPGQFTPDKRPGAHCKGGWADFSVSLDAFGKSHPKWASNPGPS